MTAPPPRPSIPPASHGARLAAARELLVDRGLQALLVGVGPDLRYLAGYDAIPLERLTMLVVTPDPHRLPMLLVPRLEEDPASRSAAAAAGLVDIRTWEEADDPHAVVAEAVRTAAPTAPRPSRDDDRPSIAVTDTLWASHLLRLQEVLPDCRFSAGAAVMGEIRIVKDLDEIALLRLAAHAADRVVDAIASGRLVDRTEAEVAREVRDRLVDEGHDSAEFAIVGSGPNSASPHHAASDRRIRPREPIVLDIGGPLGGYGSDVTRTLWVTGGESTGGPPAEFVGAYDVLRRAQAAATAAVRPGASPAGIDAVARTIITDGGYGSAFIHRTGHGIGLEAHEEPYLVAGSQAPLRPGMAFSIEPGIYLAGRWGMRLEDIVVCGVDGPDVLNETDRSLRTADGR
ncbi:MAG: aminopeptidase P family protein [Candidatus Limnocylindrales bacterium]